MAADDPIIGEFTSPTTSLSEVLEGIAEKYMDNASEYDGGSYTSYNNLMKIAQEAYELGKMHSSEKERIAELEDDVHRLHKEKMDLLDEKLTKRSLRDASLEELEQANVLPSATKPK